MRETSFRGSRSSSVSISNLLSIKNAAVSFRGYIETTLLSSRIRLVPHKSQRFQLTEVKRRARDHFLKLCESIVQILCSKRRRTVIGVV